MIEHPPASPPPIGPERHPHPLDWRRKVMVACDCCEDGAVCRHCGWHEDRENPPEIHQAHLAHVRRWRDDQESGDERARYRLGRSGGE